MILKIDFDDEKLKRGFVNVLKAQKRATAATLNTMAFLSLRNSKNNINREFITRNKYTVNSLHVDKASPSENLNTMHSVLGLKKRADYMRLHEEGGIKKPKRGNNLSIAQLASRGGAKRKLVSRNLYLKKISKQLIKGNMTRNFGSRKAITVARAKKAYDLNKFIIYNKNIYKITSFTKSKSGISFKKKHIYSLNQKRARIKRNQWMKPAIIKPVRDAQNIYNSQINKLLKKKVI